MRPERQREGPFPGEGQRDQKQRGGFQHRNSERCGLLGKLGHTARRPPPHPEPPLVSFQLSTQPEATVR